jgi:uncharacterized lipoprotein NlpE involved in copper resistance
MKNKAIIIMLLVTFTLLAGCNKEKESTTTASKSDPIPASPIEPGKTLESKPTKGEHI